MKSITERRLHLFYVSCWITLLMVPYLYSVLAYTNHLQRYNNALYEKEFLVSWGAPTAQIDAKIEMAMAGMKKFSWQLHYILYPLVGINFLAMAYSLPLFFGLLLGTNK